MQLYFISGKRLAKDVTEKMGKLQQFAHRASIAHDSEDIHQFRVTYKKLRALLRMANATGHKKDIQQVLKKLYAAAGVIRDLQIHHQTVSDYFLQYNTLPEKYLQHIQQEITSGIYAFRKVYKQVSFSRAKKLVLRHLPRKLSREKLIKWHKTNTDAIKEAADSRLQDEQIHEIRKHIKDLLYTESYISSANNYKDTAHILGDFMDSCILLTLLDKYLPHASPDEVMMLANARQHWEADKARLKEEAIGAIAQISGR